MSYETFSSSTPKELTIKRERRTLDIFDKSIFLIIAIMVVERLILFFIIGPGEISNGDDVAYIQGGITFARSGVISVWTEAPTALIMPATPIVTGIISLLFGEGTAYIAATRILWIFIGSFTAYYIYKSMCLFVPKGWALLAASAFLLPHRAWIDNIVSTETPYLFFFCANLYYMLRLREDKSISCVVKFSLTFILALSFRANIIIMPVFAAAYLVLSKAYSPKELLHRLAVFACISMIFFVPWTVRNYIRFDAFIPVSYGAGNPTLKGTYQGDSCPADEDLDYETNVYAVVREKYAKYYDVDGTISNGAHEQYILSQIDSAKAKYRMEEWFRQDPSGFLKAYLIEKPLCIQTWVYYWGPFADTIIPPTNFLSKVNFILCVFAVILAFALKKNREIVVFLSLIYWINIYIIAMSYAVERYAALLMPIRYMLSVIALYLIYTAFSVCAKKRK